MKCHFESNRLTLESESFEEEGFLSTLTTQIMFDTNPTKLSAPIEVYIGGAKKMMLIRKISTAKQV